MHDDNAELVQVASSNGNGGRMDRLVEIQQRMQAAERRLVEIDSELSAIADSAVDPNEVAAALAEFDEVWEALAPREQVRIVELLVEQVVHDAERGKIAVTFRPSGIKELAVAHQRIPLENAS